MRLRATLAFIAALAASPAVADPDVCWFGAPPPGSEKSPYMSENPFLGLEQVLGNLYIPRALCGLDVGRDQKFWRSYYQVFGCTAKSDAGRAVELWLSDAPYYYAQDFRQFRDRYPEVAKERCERLSKCTVPDRFSLTEKGLVICPEERR